MVEVRVVDGVDVTVVVEVVDSVVVDVVEIVVVDVDVMVDVAVVVTDVNPGINRSACSVPVGEFSVSVKTAILVTRKSTVWV